MIAGGKKHHTSLKEKTKKHGTRYQHIIAKIEISEISVVTNNNKTTIKGQ